MLTSLNSPYSYHSHGHVQSVTLLIQMGAEWWQQNAMKQNVFHVVAFHKHELLLRLFLCLINFPCASTVLSWESSYLFNLVNNHLAVQHSELIELPDSVSLSPLHYMAIYNQPHLMRILFRYFPSLFLDIRDSNGWTPLHFACHHQNFDSIYALKELGADESLLTFPAPIPPQPASNSNKAIEPLLSHQSNGSNNQTIVFIGQNARDMCLERGRYVKPRTRPKAFAVLPFFHFTVFFLSISYLPRFINIGCALVTMILAQILSVKFFLDGKGSALKHTWFTFGIFVTASIYTLLLWICFILPGKQQNWVWLWARKGWMTD